MRTRTFEKTSRPHDMTGLLRFSLPGCIPALETYTRPLPRAFRNPHRHLSRSPIASPSAIEVAPRLKTDALRDGGLAYECADAQLARRL